MARVSKKETQPTSLTQMEDFRLQAFESEDQKLDLEILVKQQQVQLAQKDLLLLRHKMADLARDIKKVEEEAAEKQLKKENLKVARARLVDEIKKRLGVPEEENLGYNPDTLEVIRG